MNDFRTRAVDIQDEANASCSERKQGIKPTVHYGALSKRSLQKEFSMDNKI